MPPRIWQPDHPTPGWRQAEKKSDLTVYLPLEEDVVVPMHFCRIPAGEFRMGSRGNNPSEEPIHRVVIPEDFYLGTVPVTQEQYRAMAAACLEDLQAIEGNKGVDPSHFKGDQRPVENLSWDEANVIGHWLTRSGLLPPDWQAGLPSEAHWEYACRAGTETEYWSGDGEVALAEVGWYDGNSGRATHPVDVLPANEWGFHDMHGNVWEWCADVWDAKAYRKRADGWTAAEWNEADAGDDAEYWSNEDKKRWNRYRVLRGGFRGDTARRCRSAFRDGDVPDFRFGIVGFRLCVFPGPVETGRKAESASGGKARRDAAAVPGLGDGAAPVDLSKESLAAKRPRKKSQK